MNPVVAIPARLASLRLPDKPLADIHGKPMIVHCVERAKEADIGPVVVAAGDAEIVEAVRAAGADAVITDPDLPSGSDRIQQMLERIDPGKRWDTVVNVQGDLPTLEAEAIRGVLAPLQSMNPPEIATIAAVIRREEERTNPNVVKAIAGFDQGATIARALYFTRATAPSGEGDLYHHIGLYAYRRDALDRFVNLPAGVLEQREKLEQLRALEAGMRIDVALVDTVPFGVDTQEDLDRAREMLAPG